jgi:hypothetical protein
VSSLVVFHVRHNSPSLCEPLHTLEQFCTARGLVVDEWVEASGSSFNVGRKQVLALMDRYQRG